MIWFILPIISTTKTDYELIYIIWIIHLYLIFSNLEEFPQVCLSVIFLSTYTIYHQTLHKLLLEDQKISEKTVRLTFFLSRLRARIQFIFIDIREGYFSELSHNSYTLRRGLLFFNFSTIRIFFGSSFHAKNLALTVDFSCTSKNVY